MLVIVRLPRPRGSSGENARVTSGHRSNTCTDPFRSNIGTVAAEVVGASTGRMRGDQLSRGDTANAASGN